MMILLLAVYVIVKVIKNGFKNVGKIVYIVYIEVLGIVIVDFCFIKLIVVLMNFWF